MVIKSVEFVEHINAYQNAQSPKQLCKQQQQKPADQPALPLTTPALEQGVHNRSSHDGRDGGYAWVP